MQHEKIIIRPDGSKIRISVSFYAESFRAIGSGGVHWNIGTQVCEKGKRKWQHDNLDLATPEEIYDAKLELWQMLKPQPNPINGQSQEDKPDTATAPKS